MRARKILIIDDSCSFRTKVKHSLKSLFSVSEADSVEAFRQLFKPYTFDLVILDMRLKSKREGLEVLREILSQDELQPVIMVSAFGDTDAVLDATEGGALMFLHKQDFTPELLARMTEAVLQQARIRRHLTSLQNRITVEDPLSLTTGNSLVRQAATQVARAAADPGALAIISGPIGAGQDLAAAGIHVRSQRRSSAPFLSANAGPSQPRDIRVWLFGNKARGKSATRTKGIIEEANWGILFLGQFDLLNNEIQMEVLDAVRNRALPGEPSVPIDIQLTLGCSSSNISTVVDTIRKVWENARLVEIDLPSLADRREDISLLAAYFLQNLRRQGRTTARGFDKDSALALEQWPWLGNLHELRAVIEYVGIQAMIEHSEEIAMHHLPQTLFSGNTISHLAPSRVGVYEYLAEVEVELLSSALEAHHDGVTKAQLGEDLGYTDRFALGRRMRRILTLYPEIGKKFPKIEALFK